MPNCEMCGKDSPLFKALIEGSELKVCKDCAGHGKILQRPVFVSKEKKKKEEQKEEEKEILEILAEDYSQKVKNAREKLGLTQEELAKKLNEKESVLQKIETASFRPGIELAKKLEGFLHIKIVEQTEVEKVKKTDAKKAGSDTFTLGDFIKKKAAK